VKNYLYSGKCRNCGASLDKAQKAHDNEQLANSVFMLLTVGGGIAGLAFAFSHIGIGADLPRLNPGISPAEAIFWALPVDAFGLFCGSMIGAIIGSLIAWIIKSSSK
jgi:hypothetical protein